MSIIWMIEFIKVCKMDRPGDKPFAVHRPILGSWERAEQYARSYIEVKLVHWKEKFYYRLSDFF